MALLYLFKAKMAGKVVFLALALSICKVKSQSIGCCSPSSNINGLKASPQLQFVPGQNFNLQAIPFSQLMPQSQGSQCQGSNLQKAQSVVSAPKQNIQVSSLPQISSSYVQPSNVQSSQPCPQVITTPVSAITIPPTACTTVIDCSLSNALANALQMMIANDFINSAISNNIINQDSLSIPVVETSVPSVDLNSFIRNLNANQLSGVESQTAVPFYEPEQTNDGYDWERLLSYLNEDKKKEPEPENKYDAFFKYLREKGQTADQITRQQPEVPSFTPSVQNQDDNGILQALAAYFGNNNSDTSPRYGNAAEVVFPEEIPAQLICNYGYMPTTVPVVSFSVQPLDPNCNFVVGAGGQTY
ncbi:uncharacterized protein LOC133531974 isoform X2 [Cydia pomonella]|uniref:uncharacterized protein LOC133531974 isoform X2 n=1 Tax=Cydia pomonella TaxID=82600 RepID=UPI002ADE8B3F|nr:uncharacterized protein LOC133531974 isoform X2 [Cydia pomonella]